MKKALRPDFKASGDRTRLERLPFPRQMQGGFGISGLLGVNLPGTAIDWERQAGDLSLNSIVGACLGWVCRNWPQARPTVARRVDDDKYEPVDHPLNALFARPHPNYSGDLLAQMVLQDWWTRGNGYAHVVRAGRGLGEPLELHYMPARLMWPVPASDGSSVIDHYLYRPGGQLIPVPNEDLVHFRHGLDPNNLLVGRNPLAPGLREIVTDNEASTYGAGMVMNGGVPPVVIVPKQGGAPGAPVQQLSRDQSSKIRQDFKERTTGDKRGDPLVLSSAIEIIRLAFSPKDMATDDIRRKPEERVCSLFGISPMVVDLGAGLENSTYSNKEQAEKAAIVNCLAPLWKYFGAEWTVQLLPLYGEAEADLVVWYDTRNVSALQDDLNAKSKRVVAEYGGGVAKRGEARAALGYEVDEAADDVYASEVAAPQPEPDGTDDADPAKGDGKKKGAAAGVTTPPKTRARARKDRGAAQALSSLYASADTFRASLRQHEDAAVAAMTSAYETAREAIQEKADALASRIQEARGAGTVVDEAWLSQEGRYHALLAQVTASLAALATGQAPTLTEAQKAMIGAALGGTEAMAKAALGAPPTGVLLSWVSTPAEAVEAMVGFAGDGSPLSDLLNALGPAAAEAVKAALSGGLAAGLGSREIATGIGAALDGNRARALSIARTETMRAARLASVRNYRQNADVVDGWVWLSAMDARTCPACWAMSGTEHTHDEVLDGHPQCRCVPVPKTKSWAQITGDEGLPDTRPQIPTGEARFADLPETEQQAVLGPGLHALYAAGDIALADCVVQDFDARWGTTRRAATIAEAQANAAKRGQA